MASSGGLRQSVGAFVLTAVAAILMLVFFALGWAIGSAISGACLLLCVVTGTGWRR